MKSSAVVETLEIAKHDERGRRIADAQEKEALIAGYATCGMTQRAYAQREGINPFTFAGWLRQKRQGQYYPRKQWVAEPSVEGYMLLEPIKKSRINAEIRIRQVDRRTGDSRTFRKTNSFWVP